MSDTWDAEDRAIARALDAASEAETRGADDQLVDEYREVLAQLSVPLAEPRPALEDRIIAAALERRPATVATLDRSRARRRLRVRVAVLAAATVAAAVVVGVIVHDNEGASTVARGHVNLATLRRSDVDALLTAPGTRTGVFGPDLGRVAVARDGDAALYDISGSGLVSIGLVSSGETTVIGPARPESGVVGFVVDHPERAVAVTLLRNGVEVGRAQLRP